MAVSSELRHQVRERANYRCEYCHSPEEVSAARFEIDHIQPRSKGGLDTLDNLALACQRCNAYRYNFTEGVDPESQLFEELFNPRLDAWHEHFIWEVGGLKIKGITAKGRATCARLDLNDENHNNGAIAKARRLWIKGGWHPPKYDPIASEEINLPNKAE
jgi:hypothetical protein